MVLQKSTFLFTVSKVGQQPRTFSRTLCGSVSACFFTLAFLANVIGWVNFHGKIYDPRPMFTPNRTLVVITGGIRGGELAWQSLYQRILDVNAADLALVLGQVPVDQRNSSLYDRAKYLYEFPEYEDWGDAIDLVYGNSTWRTTVLPMFDQWKQAILFGGVEQRAGSGAIMMMLRWYTTQMIDQYNLTSHYDRFVITRADHFYICPLDLSGLDPEKMWVPFGEDYQGICDRFMVSSNKNILKSINLLQPLLQHPENYTEAKPNTERLLRQRWKEQKLKVGRFDRNMFTCAVAGDPSRWSPASNYTVKEGVKLKYIKEYNMATCTCNSRKWNRKKETCKSWIMSLWG